ncbi:hypothetical protein EYR38_004997 [Pleurotus pulmonarius]|nr:hypothetical protein EYR38_004997 [Pleurotus pulmonarius]
MCPNLQRFAASLSELALEVSAGGELLNFGTAIQPSVVTIDVDGKTSYLDLFNLSQDCIRRLPFPYSIQVLTINVLKTHFGEEGFYPMASEYEVLSRSLHELYENGSLEDTVLNVKMEVGPIDVDLRIDEDRELDKVEVAFEAMFKANVLEVAFLRVRETQWTSELEPVTRISKRRV